MFDVALRRLVDPLLIRVAAWAAGARISANALTISGAGFGLGAAVCITQSHFGAALVFIVLNRIGWLSRYTVRLCILPLGARGVRMDRPRKPNASLNSGRKLHINRRQLPGLRRHCRAATLRWRHTWTEGVYLFDWIDGGRGDYRFLPPLLPIPDIFSDAGHSLCGTLPLNRNAAHGPCDKKLPLTALPPEPAFRPFQ